MTGLTGSPAGGMTGPRGAGTADAEPVCFGLVTGENWFESHRATVFAARTIQVLPQGNWETGRRPVPDKPRTPVTPPLASEPLSSINQ